jgi:hypothetical protein
MGTSQGLIYPCCCLSSLGLQHHISPSGGILRSSSQHPWLGVLCSLQGCQMGEIHSRCVTTSNSILIGSFSSSSNVGVSSRPSDPLSGLHSHLSTQISSFTGYLSSSASDDGYGSRWPDWVLLYDGLRRCLLFFSNTMSSDLLIF